MAAGIPHPASIRVAVGLWLATATFGVLNTIFYWTQYDTVRDALIREKVAEAEKIATTLLTFHSTTMVFFGVLYVAFGLLLRQGRSWARLALTIAAVLHLIFTLRQGLTAEGLLVAVLLAGALLTSWWRTSTDWLLAVKTAR
ncbi:hypothetical protein [Crossiella cryophila]|uniref:Glucan phosphoethanolaminetransferase (Alkaline phosphatase superfamily) n=1 Tax=Crossiella cryophila TaxID=43355 RepID=A0A7W7C752_9PSEU|nr:hypothetical protein [Crossiella cryophila]MBB4674478.1 glucan phosphoethanolaminetransferase (alkaline phosphatase superfamily) [Crossiella cryophila]